MITESMNRDLKRLGKLAFTLLDDSISLTSGNSTASAPAQWATLNEVLRHARETRFLAERILTEAHDNYAQQRREQK